MGRKEKEVTLLYRASRDGFSPETFHDKCDNQGPTLTVAESDTGKIFGGYTNLSWRRLLGNKK